MTLIGYLLIFFFGMFFGTLLFCVISALHGLTDIQEKRGKE